MELEYWATAAAEIVVDRRSSLIELEQEVDKTPEQRRAQLEAGTESSGGGTSCGTDVWRGCSDAPGAAWWYVEKTRARGEARQGGGGLRNGSGVGAQANSDDAVR
jgi:hypothetical protein